MIPKTQTPEYKTWAAIKARCLSPSAGNYYLYGGRGITICSQWRHSFETFLKDMGKKPSPDHSIGRIDNNKGYSPDNCRWETPKQQAANRRLKLYVLFRGESIAVLELSKKFSVPKHILYTRIKRGRSVEDAIFREVSNYTRG